MSHKNIVEITGEISKAEECHILETDHEEQVVAEENMAIEEHQNSSGAGEAITNEKEVYEKVIEKLRKEFEREKRELINDKNKAIFELKKQFFLGTAEGKFHSNIEEDEKSLKSYLQEIIDKETERVRQQYMHSQTKIVVEAKQPDIKKVLKSVVVQTEEEKIIDTELEEITRNSKETNSMLKNIVFSEMMKERFRKKIVDLKDQNINLRKQVSEQQEIIKEEERVYRELLQKYESTKCDYDEMAEQFRNGESMLLRLKIESESDKKELEAKKASYIAIMQKYTELKKLTEEIIGKERYYGLQLKDMEDEVQRVCIENEDLEKENGDLKKTIEELKTEISMLKQRKLQASSVKSHPQKKILKGKSGSSISGQISSYTEESKIFPKSSRKSAENIESLNSNPNVGYEDISNELDSKSSISSRASLMGSTPPQKEVGSINENEEIFIHVPTRKGGVDHLKKKKKRTKKISKTPKVVKGLDSSTEISQTHKKNKKPKPDANGILNEARFENSTHSDNKAKAIKIRIPRSPTPSVREISANEGNQDLIEIGVGSNTEGEKIKKKSSSKAFDLLNLYSEKLKELSGEVDEILDGKTRTKMDGKKDEESENPNDNVPDKGTKSETPGKRKNKQKRRDSGNIHSWNTHHPSVGSSIQKEGEEAQENSPLITRTLISISEDDFFKNNGDHPLNSQNTSSRHQTYEEIRSKSVNEMNLSDSAQINQHQIPRPSSTSPYYKYSDNGRDTAMFNCKSPKGVHPNNLHSGGSDASDTSDFIQKLYEEQITKNSTVFRKRIPKKLRSPDGSESEKSPTKRREFVPLRISNDELSQYATIYHLKGLSKNEQIEIRRMRGGAQSEQYNS